MSDKRSVSVLIPTPLRRFTNGEAKLAIEAATLGELLDAVDRDYPGVGERVRDDSGQIRRFVNVFVNGANVRDGAGLDTPLSPGDEVGIIPAMAGGAAN